MDNQVDQLSRVEKGKDGDYENILKSSKWGWSKFEGITAGNLQLWNNLFVISCTIAVSLDPLFFYIPKVDRDNLCVGRDKMMRTAALVLRGITDTILILHLIFLIYNRYNENKHRVNPTEEANLHDGKKIKSNVFSKLTEKVAQKMPWWMCMHLVVDLLCLVPVPQSLIGIVYRSLKYPQFSSDTGRNKNVLYFAILAQYVPRIYQIQLSSKKVTKSHGILAKGLFNFFLFILASHVLGAFWYAFSLETEVSCWSWLCALGSEDTETAKACSAEFLCTTATVTDFSIRNVTYFKEYCYAEKDENFLYGIFFDAIDSGSTSKDVRFSVKFWYCFWWGLRNISNYGTNLATTVYLWENVFAILVSIVGLLLFVFLIGNLQTFMGMKVKDTKSEETKLTAKRLDAQRWITRYGLPKHMEKEIVRNHISKARLEEERDYTLENLFSFAPPEIQHWLRKETLTEALKEIEVPRMLETMDEAMLEMMCDYLIPMTFKENTLIFRKGTPLDFMLFIIDGTVLTYSTATPGEGEEGGKEKTVSISPSSVDDGCKFYGQELLHWASSSTSDQPPMSTYNVMSSQGKVEALVIRDDDLKTIMRNNLIKNRQDKVASSTITRRPFPPGRPAVIPTDRY